MVQKHVPVGERVRFDYGGTSTVLLEARYDRVELSVPQFEIFASVFKLVFILIFLLSHTTFEMPYAGLAGSS